MMIALSTTLREVFAQSLQSKRKELQLSKEELAHRVDLDRTSVSALERSAYAVLVDVIEKIAL